MIATTRGFATAAGDTHAQIGLRSRRLSDHAQASGVQPFKLTMHGIVVALAQKDRRAHSEIGYGHPDPVFEQQNAAARIGSEHGEGLVVRRAGFAAMGLEVRVEADAGPEPAHVDAIAQGIVQVVPQAQ